jgi:hypothetical protein
VPLVNKALKHIVLDHADCSIVVMLITAEFVPDITNKSGQADRPALQAVFQLICAGEPRPGSQNAFVASLRHCGAHLQLPASLQREAETVRSAA